MFRLVLVTVATLHLAMWSTLAQFNDTVRFTLDSMDPMIEFRPDGGPWLWDPVTGYSSYGNMSYASIYSTFVGTGYEMRGSVAWGRPMRNLSIDGSFEIWLRNANSTIQVFNISQTQEPVLSSFSPLKLDLYSVEMDRPAGNDWFRGSNFTFHNFTFDVPVRSQA